MKKDSDIQVRISARSDTKGPYSKIPGTSRWFLKELFKKRKKEK